MKCILILSLLALSACASKETDSDRIVNEFEKAGKTVGGGIKKGVENVEEGLCKFFNKDTNKCED